MPEPCAENLPGIGLVTYRKTVQVSLIEPTISQQLHTDRQDYLEDLSTALLSHLLSVTAGWAVCPLEIRSVCIAYVKNYSSKAA